MNQIGDKRVIGNPEDISSLRVLEINDIYEVSPSETYFEIIEKPLICNPRILIPDPNCHSQTETYCGRRKGR